MGAPIALAPRPESERQELIRELRELRARGEARGRQEVIEHRLRSEWELGWPPPERPVVVR